MAPKRRQARKPAQAEEPAQQASPEEHKDEEHQPQEQQVQEEQHQPEEQPHHDDQDAAGPSNVEEDKKPAARSRASQRARPAPARPAGVTKRITRAKPAAKEAPQEEKDGEEPKPAARSRRAPASTAASKKPAAHSRAPTSKRAAQKEEQQEAEERKPAAPRSRSRAAAPKKDASEKAAAPARKAATPRKRAAAPASRSRSRATAAPSRRRGAKKEEEKDQEHDEMEEPEQKKPTRARAPARGRQRGKAAAAAEEAAAPSADEGAPEDEQAPARPTGRGEAAEKRGARKPATEAMDAKPRRPAPKRKAQEAAQPSDKEATPSTEEEAASPPKRHRATQATPSAAEEEGARATKRQRVTKVPKGAAPSADSEAMAAVHALAKKPPAEVFVWGSNPFGGLGLGEEETLKFRPTQVPVPGVQFAEVVCGGMHTVALSNTGEIWTWGVNDEGALGRKTLGTAWEAYPDEEKADEKVPGRAVLPDGVRMVEIAAGDGFTVALSPNGSVYGCGTFKDDVGGLSGFTDKVKVQSLMTLLYAPGHPKDEAVKLVAGARHCAILTKNGTVLTWGIGGQGQLGRLPAFDAHSTPPVSELFVPKPVPPHTISIRSTSIATIASGAYSTFVISKSGDVVAWGLNNSCQLAINKGDEQNNIVWEPTKVTSINKVSMIRGGEQHTLILSKDGRLFSCGAPTYGMLGREGLDVNNANDKYFEPKPVHGFGEPPEKGKAVKHLEAGTNISACTQEDGSAWLWGSQVNYQLAKGDTEEDALVPEKLKRTKTFGFRKIYTISFGGQHAALLAGPQEEAPPPAPPVAEPALPAQNGAGPSGVPAPPAPAAPADATTIAAEGAAAGVSAAATEPSAPPPAPAPSAMPAEAGAADSLANPSQSAVEAAMAWAQQMVSSGGAGGLAGGTGFTMPSSAPVSEQPEAPPQQPQQQTEQPAIPEGAKAQNGQVDAAMQGGEGAAGPADAEGQAQQEGQQQQEEPAPPAPPAPAAPPAMGSMP